MATDPLVQQAAQILRAGGLVAFPTETVYGLGADARNADAVRRVFAVKGRPETHPLIVHIGSVDELFSLAREVPAAARLLADRFWPGPLTLVVEKSDAVLPCVTGGQATVAVRMPSHPLALALLRELGGPIVAPSANRFGRVSPTTAEHVRADLGGDVDMVLDGGSAEVGVESTIVDVTGDRARILRLGGLAVEELERTLGEPVLANLDEGRVPGQLPSHYAPRAKVLVVSEAELAEQAEALARQGASVAVLAPPGAALPAGTKLRAVPSDPAGYARELYAGLRALDSDQPDFILVVPPEARGIGRAVADRLRRAAAPR